jgi:hypothetical protein
MWCISLADYLNRKEALLTMVKLVLRKHATHMMLCFPYDLVHMTLYDRHFMLCIWSFPYDQHVTRSYHSTISRVTHFILLHYSWPIRIGFKSSLSLLPPPVYWQCHDSLIGYLSELSLFRRGLLDYTCWIILELSRLSTVLWSSRSLVIHLTIDHVICTDSPHRLL